MVEVAEVGLRFEANKSCSCPKADSQVQKVRKNVRVVPAAQRCCKHNTPPARSSAPARGFKCQHSLFLKDLTADF